MALRLTFDLMDLLNEAESGAKRKALSRFVRQDVVKREFGNRVIDEIKDRTLKGRDKNERPFVPYSKAYKDSLEFQVFGKSSRVNLKLSGEMQASINVLKTDSTSVTIGFLSAEQEQKATGHVMGSGPLPVRDFWGIDKKDQVGILKSVIKDLNADNAAQEFADALADIGGVILEGELFKGDDLISNVTLEGDLSGEAEGP